MPNIYIGRLMIKTRTRNAQELVKSSVNLEQEELFAKALQYSGEKAKEILSKYIHINRRANSRA